MSKATPTLPAEAPRSYETTRFNALRHGILSRHTVLHWEDEAEYQELVEALAAEHAPDGPTEEHLVEELAGILWRKRRLRLAEAAAHQRGLAVTMDLYSATVCAALAHLDAGKPIERVVDAIRARPAETVQEIRDLEEDVVKTAKALKVLRASGAAAYEKALGILKGDTREWWEQQLGRDPDDLHSYEEPEEPNADCLQQFLEEERPPWYVQRRKELENRPLIRAQAFGESLDPDNMMNLARYEVHLDRKLERTLAMLLRLQDLRRETDQE